MKKLFLQNSKKIILLVLCAFGCLCARAQTEAQTQESDSTASNILPPVDIAEVVIQVANFNDMFQDTTGIFFRRLREFHKTTGYKLEVGAYLSGIQKSSFWSNMVQILFSSTDNAQDSTIQGNAVNIDVGWKIDSDGRLEGKMRQSVSNLSGNIMPEALQMFRDSIDIFHEAGLDSIKNSRAPDYILALLTILEAGLTDTTPVYTITLEQLQAVFPDTPEERLKEVVEAVNKYSGEFEISTPERMAHFIGQIGAESKGLTNLKESSSYSPRAIAQIFPYPKYGHLFEKAFLDTTTYLYSYTPINFDENSCSDNKIARGSATFSYTSTASIRNAYAEVKNDTITVILNGKKTKVPTYKTRTDVTKNNIETKVPNSSYNSGRLRIKSKYIKSSALFDVTYACRMGNGSVASKDGSTFLGKGFIHITGKDGYKKISEEWNKLYPDDPKAFHGKDINLLETDVEVAMKASMVYWKIKELNGKADKGFDDNAIDDVGRIINGSKNNRPNGADLRIKYTQELFQSLNN